MESLQTAEFPCAFPTVRVDEENFCEPILNQDNGTVPIFLNDFFYSQVFVDHDLISLTKLSYTTDSNCLRLLTHIVVNFSQTDHPFHLAFNFVYKISRKLL